MAILPLMAAASAEDRIMRPTNELTPGWPGEEHGRELLPFVPPTAATDPVCGMSVDPANVAGSAEHDGWTYHFCGTQCLHKFLSGVGFA